ncbi:MAG: hypothetical protein LBH42_06725 [Treponema sp.]|jgi:hypothetical protein|nr:hypothetical protein [Treponema sp.]
MDIGEVEKLQKETRFDRFIGTLQKVTLKKYEYGDLFKMGNDRLGYYSLKIRKNDNRNILESLELLKIINDAENIINENVDVIEKDNLVIIISEWLTGKQPIDDCRDELPEFFCKLAILNKNNIVGGPFTSMYLDGNYFNSANELIDWELNYHKKYFPESFDQKIILEVLGNLKCGMSCIINEDMNCGNLFITSDGKFKIVDTDWIIKGVNLYQFQHFDYFGFDGKKWYKITDEAAICYAAYFDTLGTGREGANEQIRAVELLNTLRENTCRIHSGKENEKEMEGRIKTILEKKRFI